MASVVTKELFPQREASLTQAARWFHALSDETRLRIIDRLSAGEQCVCDLTDILETGQSRLSFHLKILKDAGILKDRREGRWVYYCLNAEVVEELGQFVSGLKTCCRRVRSASRCCE
ncbi:MAG: winged helix-turn-helix transcriptional regulator [Deltaproteobacteria bacterium]|nr:winged helix-turn-helix transcriptional regulator [Deltaproteobacteria bacterium]